MCIRDSRRSDEPPRDAVPVRIHLDAGVVVDTALELTFRSEGPATVERPQFRGLGPFEAHDGLLASRPMDADVGDGTLPFHEPRRQGLPARELAAGDRVSLHVPHAALVLA